MLQRCCFRQCLNSDSDLNPHCAAGAFSILLGLETLKPLCDCGQSIQVILSDRIPVHAQELTALDSH